ncbi:MAG: hypothetical protein DRJ03_19580, partial [Chloroflexi bacterium]
IRDGTLHLSSSGDVENSTALSDFSLSFMARRNVNSTGDFWVIFRITGDYDDNSYRLTWTGTTLQLYEYNTSGDHNIGSSVSAPDALVWHHFEIRTQGSQIEVYVDGELQISVIDDSHAGGYTQIRTLTTGSDYDVDDILITRFGQTACTVGANDHVTYTIPISNQARIPGYDLVITDSIPAGMSLLTYTMESDDPDSTAIAWPVPIPGATGDLVWHINQLTATSPFSPLNHTALTLTVVLSVSDGITANITLPNQASLTYSSQSGPGPVGVERDYSGGSHSTAVRTVDGFIAKQILLGPPPTATLGEVVTYTVQVPASPITATLYSVTVTDELDDRLMLQSVNGPGGTVTTAGNAFTVTYPSIVAGEQRFITVTAVLSSPLDAHAGDVITNLAVLEHRDGGPTPSEEPPFTVTEPSLTLVKASDPPTSNTVRAGDSVTYTVVITNWSDAYASPAYDVAFTDTLPVGMRDAAPTLITVTLDGAAVPYDSGYNAATGVFTLTFSSAFSIPVGGELEIQYVATVDADVAAAQDLTNQAQVTWSSLPGDVDGDRDYGPEEDDTTVHTPPANALSKGVTPLTVTIGSQVVFSATLPDPPEGVVLHNVVFTDVVDARLRVDDLSATGSASWGVDGQTVTATWASIPTYTQRYVYITTTLRHMPTTTMGTQITNVAIFSHDMLTAPVESNVVTTTIIYDWGDLPDSPYPTTLLPNDGPRHVISPTLYLGSRVDAESDGQPSIGADGDDTTGFPDDEDGVEWQPLVLGRNSIFTITASADNGYLNGWIDFNADGDFDDAGEHIISGALLSAGVNTFTVPVPTTATIISSVYMRFRYSTQQDLSPSGAAPDGEVEDYVTTIIAYDWGDLPDTPYPTLLSSDGARHVISPTLYLGARVDAEGDGQPSLGADSDDNTDTSGVGINQPDDEDGVEWQPLILGRESIFTITASAGNGYLNGWIDFNANGDLDDAGEHVFSGTLLSTGVNTFTVIVPTTTTITSTTYMRFRYSTEQNLQPTGAAPDGEVEDYIAPLTAYDLGDLPQGPYPTTLAQNGPIHVISPTNNPTLGDTVDAEGDGQPSASADGDDNTLAPDDEDGVRLDSTLIAGEVATLTITATNASGAYLNGWIDFDGDGALEQIFTDTTLNVGVNTLTFTVPTVVLSDTLNARFRYSTDSGLTTTGLASDGEVEDHQFEPTPLDWGDLPQPYPTRIISDGARHVILDAGNPTLGAIVDAELDGQPSVNADGDDTAGAPDDEDGVTFSGPLVPGETVTITVTATDTTGLLNAWLDFDGNGSLTDSGEQVALNETITAGESITLVIPVPLTATQGITTYARFRFSTDSDLTPTGLAFDGEIEDYAIPIREMDYGDAPDVNYNTVYTNSGARHVISPTNNPTLGSIVDAETDGAPSFLADGDDTTGLPDDEDGVTFDSELVPGEVATITVSAAITGSDGVLNAWIDFDIDGDWSEASDHIVTNRAITAGTSAVITFNVPSTATQAATYARFRFSTQPDLTPTGLAPDGEVEDYIVGVKELDYGDAPDSYSTRFTDDGARHIITGTNPTLGVVVDDELDGAPSPGADGDDTADSDDEDGVLFGGDLIPGEVVAITVTAAPTATGILNAWVDFGGDGDWDEAIDQIVANRTIISGTSVVITFSVPLTAAQGITTYARFRFSTQPDLTPTGLAPDGEVEDYVLHTLRLDYGDAPEPTYPTYRASDGPRHIILDVDNPTLGDTVDAESNGQPNSTATGDDIGDAPPDDEDGVRLDSTLIAGQVATLTITATNTSANLSAWIDFDGDGVYEQVFTDTTLNVGVNTLTFTVPTVVLSDTLNGRFRYSTDSGLAPTGLASDGEIEDHQFEPTPLDWGDLPQGLYPTRIISDGARHVILDVNNPTLGAIVDAELDGQPSINADGDDNNDMPDDEDGVTFSGPLVPGETVTITVSATDTTGILNAWLDFDGNGSLTDSGEQIALNVTINAGGSVQLLVPVPVSATQGITTYARFRFSTQSDLAPTGLASDGEIEDYAIPIRELEYGDLPDGPYPTYRASDGARHIFDGGVTYLGSAIDTEDDGQPSVNADGDDGDLDGDDEDGVTFITPLMQGQPAQIRVEAGSNGYLNGWIDFDGDGALDTINVTAIDGTSVISTMNDISMTTGVHTFTIGVPDAPISSSVYSRFRFTSYDTNGALSYTGLAADGEVEDYVLMSLGNFVWHDNGSGSGVRNDGALNGSESGIPGVELELYRYDDLMTPIAATTTDAGGYYNFTGLTPYTYVVHIP